MELAPGAGISAASPELGFLPSWGKATETLPRLPLAESLGFSRALIEIMTLQD